MREIGIFSGSFNPIHVGHVALAEHICRACGLDGVWLVVTPRNPLKPQASLIDEQHRLRMARLAVRSHGCLRASDVEFSLPRPSYTCDTLRHLRQLHPRTRFSLIIGSDNMALFDHWRNWEEILQTTPVLVYPRPGDDMDALRRRFPQMRVVEGAPLLPVSSTDIRALLRESKPTAPWLDPSVAAYIERHGLYR